MDDHGLGAGSADRPRRIVSALGAVHVRAIIHRDLKPPEKIVLVTGSGREADEGSKMWT